MRAAIVGCGGIAAVHAEALEKMDGITLTACADILPERARKLAKQYGAVPYASLCELLQEETVDVLHICTPHALHTPMVKMAADRGIDVFCEKPPVISKEQWTELEEAAKLVRVAVCFQNRYNPETKEAGRLLARPEAGPIRGARAFVTWNRDAAYYTESGWRGRLATEGGGVLINQAIHTLDLLLGFLGEPTAVSAGMSNHHLADVIEVEDTLEACLSYPGYNALFYASTGHCTDAPVFLEVICENTTIRIEGHEVSCRWKDGRTERFQHDPAVTTGKSYWGSGHESCIRDFYDSLRQNRDSSVALPTAAVTVRTFLSLYESAREHKTISLTQEAKP